MLFADFRKYKGISENMPAKTFCYYFLQERPINSITSPASYDFIAFSKDTHISYPDGHIGIWAYGNIAIFWPYGQIVICLYGYYVSQYGCVWKE